MAFVYILKTKNGQYYIGSTDDLERRLRQHRNKHTATTARLGSFELVLKQEYKTLVEARKIERKIKNLKRKDYVEKMIKEGYIKIQP